MEGEGGGADSAEERQAWRDGERNGYDQRSMTVIKEEPSIAKHQETSRSYAKEVKQNVEKHAGQFYFQFPLQ